MKKNIFKKVIILACLMFVFISFAIPTNHVFATDTSYNLLTPLPNPDGTQMDTFDPSQTSNLSVYLNLMIKLFIGICAVLAVIMIVMGGIEYMTSELVSSKAAGKERILHAIFGLLLALGAWTLLNTINPDLLDSSLKSLADVTVEVELNADIPQATPPPGGKYADGSIPGASWQPGIASVSLPSGVTINNGGVECTTVGQHNCTSTKGLDPSIINKISSSCVDCSLIITGGTESWEHSAGSSHRPGSPTIDLRVNNNLNNYITGGKTPIKNDRFTKDGVSYLYEVDHWHVYKK